VCLRLEATNQFVVQFWSVNNYHWYLKQHFVVPLPAAVSSGALCWDPERALTFALASTDGRIRYRPLNPPHQPRSVGLLLTPTNCCVRVRCLEWCWDVCVSNSASRRVAVIDAQALLCTPIGKMIVPPPMSGTYSSPPHF
jgi:hypothetical protein